jgi:hypothetical protein
MIATAWRRVLAAAAATALACSLPLMVAAHADDSQDARARFRKEMEAVYDYLPADVTQDVRDRKVKEMDRFWAFVASDLKSYLPFLRDALKDEKSNRYFLYDGSGLLVEHAKDPADWQLAADATARCRVKDVGKGYFWFCHHLAKNGADDVAAILQMLDDPGYRVFVPQHSLLMKQAECVRLCLLVVGEERWVAPLVKRLATEKEPTAVATVLHCLADAVTPESDAAIRARAADEKADAAARATARAELARIDAPASVEGTATMTRDALAAWLRKADEAGRLPADATTDATIRDARLLVTASDVAILRSLRRKTARRVSDEALGEIDSLTELLRRATAKPR